MELKGRTGSPAFGVPPIYLPQLLNDNYFINFVIYIGYILFSYN